MLGSVEKTDVAGGADSVAGLVVGFVMSSGRGGGLSSRLQTKADQQIASSVMVVLRAALTGRPRYAQQLRLWPPSLVPTAVPALKPSGVPSSMYTVQTWPLGSVAVTPSGVQG